MLDDLVRGYAVAALETARAAGNLSTVRDELTVFDRALLVSDGLRLALTDPGLSAVARRGITADLLVDRADEVTAAIVGFVVRVVRPSEVPSVISETVGLALSTEGDSTLFIDAEAPAGRIGARERIRGYAERVFQELSSPDELDQIEDDLFRFARLLDSNPELRRVLEDANFTLAPRIAVLSDLLATRSLPGTLRLATYVVRAGRLRNLVGTFDWLVELVAEERGRRVGEVRSAVPLDDDERARLAVALGRLVGRTVEIRVIEDASVIGGMVVAIGDLVIDGTVRLRFERLRDVFAQQA
jgi:F-type H+-transporting ATPase subunit delta